MLLSEIIKPSEKIIFKKIEKECSSFVRDMKAADKVLYRGMNSSKGNYIEDQSRNNRFPTDTETDIQEKFDKILKDNGFKALRSNSIFVTSGREYASDYINGSAIQKIVRDLYLIFPKNGYSFTWSNKKVDWVIKRKEISKPEGFIKRYDLRNTDMLGALKSEHEIYIHGRFIGLQWDRYEEKVIEYFGLTEESVMGGSF